MAVCWDPQQYLQYEHERERPWAELLARVVHPGPSEVVDLGCGPGTTTTRLLARWPDAHILGIDSSAETLTPAPAPAPVAVADASQTPTMSDSTTAGGGTYTIKQGDTLWKIATAHYGDGKKWKEIVDANPGLEPSKLRVGQTITLP